MGQMNRLIVIALILMIGGVSGFSQPLDYSNKAYWAALPDRQDNADLVPGDLKTTPEGKYNIDIFFLHPTSYNGNRLSDSWNAPIDNNEINQHTDDKSIKYQASLFNVVGKIYAPRYRQSHISAYFTSDTASAMEAFEFAYLDIENAFQYYMKHFNQGRPFIIASHSQGTNHAIRLIKEHIQGKMPEEKMIVAYLVGMPVFPDDIKLTPCETPVQTGCYCSWRTFLEGYMPPYIANESPIIVTNPITWTTINKGGFTDPELHKGAVLFNFNKRARKGIVRANIHKNVLWIKKPDVFGKVFYNRKNYHIGDFNLFYADIQSNAQLRTEAFLNSKDILTGSKD